MSDLELLPEDDALAGLEDRLLKVVEQIPALRKERDEAVAERDAARKSSLAALEEAQRLRAEVERDGAVAARRAVGRAATRSAAAEIASCNEVAPNGSTSPSAACRPRVSTVNGATSCNWLSNVKSPASSRPGSSHAIPS